MKCSLAPILAVKPFTRLSLPAIFRACTTYARAACKCQVPFSPELCHREMHATQNSDSHLLEYQLLPHPSDVLRVTRDLSASCIRHDTYTEKKLLRTWSRGKAAGLSTSSTSSRSMSRTNSFGKPCTPETVLWNEPHPKPETQEEMVHELPARVACWL